MTLGAVNYAKRIEKVRASMDQQGISALIMTRLQGISYLSGAFVPYRGALFLPLKGDPVLLPSLLEASRIAQETWMTVSGWTPFPGMGWTDHTDRLVRQAGLEKARLGIESGISPRVTTGYITAGEVDSLKRLLPEAVFVEANNIIEEICKIKEPIEIAYMRQAGAIADAGHRAVLAEIRPGMTEAAVAGIGERAMREAGSEWNWPFSGGTEIASGYRAGYPNCGCTPPTRKIIQEGEIVFVDLHCTYNLYYSDYSTNIIMGNPTRAQADLSSVFTEAANILIEKMQPGVVFGEVFGAVMQFLTEKGYSGYTVPVFGHGIGIAGDEFYPPVMGVPPWSEMVLQPNMVEEAYFQLNLPGVGGFRLEAPLLITDRGNELLCKVSWEPRILNRGT